MFKKLSVIATAAVFGCSVTLFGCSVTLLLSIVQPAGVYASHGHVFREPGEDVLNPCKTKAIDCGDMSIYEEDSGYDVGYEKDKAVGGESDDPVIYETPDESGENH
jgi:hypothetical protein